MGARVAPPHSQPPHLPGLMLMLFTRSALRAVLVSVSITWSLCSTTSPWGPGGGGVRPCPIYRTHLCPASRAPKEYLLLVVLPLHVQHEEAVAQAADRDPWGEGQRLGVKGQSPGPP